MVSSRARSSAAIFLGLGSSTPDTTINLPGTPGGWGGPCPRHSPVSCRFVPDPFVSYAQNGEDVVLWRVLGHVRNGRYVDVGGYDPDEDSVTKAFYDRGWRGIDVEPVPEFAEKFRRKRPGNEVVEAVITREGGTAVLHQVVGTGLSTLDDVAASEHGNTGYERRDITVSARTLDDVLTTSSLLAEGEIHFLKVDVEGAEDAVLDSVDLSVWRPWVIVVEATEPNSTSPSHQRWEPVLLSAGYSFCLFDGLSRFYISHERHGMAALLSYPACTFDQFITVHHQNAVAQLGTTTQQLYDAEGEILHWRDQAIAAWAESAAKVISMTQEAQTSRREVESLRRRLVRAHDQNARLKGKVGQLTKRLAIMDGRAGARMRRKTGRVLRRLGLR